MDAIEKKLAQLLIVGFNGCDLETTQSIQNTVQHYGLGGVLLFDKTMQGAPKNIICAQQLRDLNRVLQNLHRFHHNTPLLISIDCEGGAVDRLASLTTELPSISAKDLSKMSVEAFTATLSATAEHMCSLGINFNFAPVVDLDISNGKGIINGRGRSFGADAEHVAQCAERFSEIFARLAIQTCYKHFPGHGSAQSDSHLGYVDVSRTFTRSELLPYMRLAKKGHAAIMTAHVVNRTLDASGTIATMSPIILQKMLRQELGFNGMVISDDLQMKAVSDRMDIVEAMCGAINAGCDMLIIGNQLDYHPPEILIQHLRESYYSGKLQSDRVAMAYKAVMDFKKIFNNV